MSSLSDYAALRTQHRRMRNNVQLRWITSALICALVALSPIPVTGQGPARERFLPAEQLDAILQKNPSGVMLPRQEFRDLLNAAQEAARKSDHPVDAVIKSAEYSVEQVDQHAVVELTVTVEQFVDNWTSMKISIGNLLLEEATIGDQNAIVGRAPQQHDSLLLLHQASGTYSVKFRLSTPLASVGSDRVAAFRTIQNVPTSVSVACPAGQLLEMNSLKLQRPAALDQAATYKLPAGNLKDVRLKWTNRRQQSETQSLVFGRTAADILLTTDNSRWDSTTRISVFGSSVNELIARVPSTLEITSVDSAGLEAWKLEDDAEKNGYTRLKLTYRQPFSEDRIVRISAVASLSDDESSRVPTLEFLNVTSHSGRLSIQQEDQLRLMATVSSGIRHVGTNRSAKNAAAAEIFDFWLQDYTLNVAVRPRDQELFAEVNSTLTIVNTTASFLAEVTIESLNAPLFELPLQLPDGWQLISISNDQQQAVKWRQAADENRVVVEPATPVATDGLLALKVLLQRTINDPATAQTIAVPVVVPVDSTLVGGTYRLSSSNDMTITPVDVTGLTAIRADGTSLLFETLTSDYSGNISVKRKLARLAARGIVTSWMDTRMKTTEATVTVDVVNGTTRTLQLQVPEELGEDIRFHVVSLTPVPGLTGQSVPSSLQIIEQTPGEVVDGVRNLQLTFDKRFLGAVTLSTSVEQPRGDDSNLQAAFVRVSGAVRQHGLAAFQAYPEQELSVEEDSLEGVTSADPGLVEAPPAATGRRTALVFRYIQPVYSLSVSEKRFATETVPSAVCTMIKNISVLSDTGRIQRSCNIYFKCSGVQTLRFALPDADEAYLWSTILNNKAVEVRRDEGDYLVAIPSDVDTNQLHLEILFESATDTSASGEVDQHSIELAIDTDKGQAENIDILQQTWEVRYPETSQLVAADGGFDSQQPLENPGWFHHLTSLLKWPTWETAATRSIPFAVFAVALFVFTTLILKRRWKSLGAFCLLSGLGVMVVLGNAQLESALPTSELFVVQDGAKARVSGGTDMAFSFADGAEFGDDMEYEDAFVESAPQESSAPQTAAPLPPGDANGGFGGMGGGGFGGGGGLPQPNAAQPPNATQSRNGVAGRRYSTERQGGAVADFETSIMLFNQSGNAPTPNRFGRSGDAGTNITLQQAPPVPLGGPAGLQSHTIRNVAPQFSPGDVFTGGVQEVYAGKAIGGARLSIRAAVSSPRDYQSKTFRSIGGTPESGRLNVTIQNENRLHAYRIIAMAIALLVCLSFRNASSAQKIGLATTLVMLGSAAVALASNQWQCLVDGLLIGTFAGVALWLLRACLQCLKCCWNWCRGCCGSLFRSKSAVHAGMLVAASLLLPSTTEAQPPVPRPDVVLPYADGEPELLAERVFLPKDEFLTLYRLANPGEFSSAKAPHPDLVLAAFYKAGERRKIRDKQWSQTLSARFIIRTFKDEAIVRLPIGQVAIRSAKLNETEAILTPVRRATSPNGKKQSSKGQKAANAAPGKQTPQAKQNGQPVEQRYLYGLRVKSAGLHVLDLQFEVPATIENEAMGRIDLPLLPVSSGTLSFTPPQENLDVRVNGRSNGYRTVKDALLIPIAGLNQLRIEWQPSSTRKGTDVVSHAVVHSSLTIDDAGLTLHSTLNITCRQGELPAVDISIPQDYAVQRVSSPNLASWAVDGESAPRLKVQFQKPIDGTTHIDLTLFRKQVITKKSIQLAVPVPALVGASRDSGTVTILAGRELEARVHSLSGVIQLNPADAVMPNGPPKGARRVLAWRYTRHPLAISVRVFRTADKLQVTTLNGVQLDVQRQLWTSLIKATIDGAPRRRLEVVVPRDFLALEVTGNDLADWYFSDADNTDDDSKILNLQFNEARTGTINAVIQGQTGRTDDASLAKLSAPFVLGADSSSDTQLSVWLDPATTIRNFTADGWAKSPGVAAVLKLQPLAPAISFAARGSQPGDIQLTLDETPAAFVCESVYVSNVTDTSVELTLGMKWKFSGTSATRTFAFSIPSALADVYDFTIPGLRQLVREDDENTVRFTVHLQQPVTQQFFILGAGSIPLPESGEIEAQAPEFLAAEGTRTSITSQSHFWVIVNQSTGLLQPVDRETDGEDVDAKDIRTKIPKGFLEQSVAIRRLRPDSQNSAWQLRFPRQEKVSPAIVALAAHTTIIAEDGTWRSRHTLTVRNESRQFLPVTLPQDSRFLFALVGGQPTRIVSRTIADQTLHLIPIPQSGVAAVPFEVQFAVAGKMTAQIGSIEGRLLKIPMPVFPEFRESPDYGITVSRNTWTVFIPDEWRAHLEENPRLSNVIPATMQDFNLAVFGCVADNSRSMINSLKSSRQQGIADAGLLRNLAQQKSMLESQVVTTESAEAERQDVLKQLEELLPPGTNLPAVQFESGGIAIGGQLRGSVTADQLGQNFFLNNNDINTNAFNSINNGELLLGNTASSVDYDAIAEPERFKFRLPEAMIEKSSEALGLKDATAAKKNAKKKSGNVGEETATSDEKPGSQRSQLLQRRESNRKMQLNIGGEQQQLLAPRLQVTDNDEMALQQQVAEPMFDLQLSDGTVQQTEEQSLPNSGGEIRPQQLSRANEGTLSLNFDIPQNGERLNFVRTGGNAELTLRVRDREATTMAFSLLWAAGCGIVLLLLLTGLSKGHTNFFFRLLILLTLDAFVGWLLLPSYWRPLALTLCIGGLILISATTIVSSFLNRQRNWSELDATGTGT